MPMRLVWMSLKMRNNEVVPQWRKIDLVRWAIRRFPDSPSSKFSKMRKKQLWAIFFSVKKSS